MSDDLTVFSSSDLKDLAQDLRDLFSQTRVSFLLGAGCSSEAGLPMMADLTELVMKHDSLDPKTKEVLESIQALFAGTGSPTIEDYMSEMVDHLSIAQRRSQSGAKQTAIPIGTKESDAAELETALDEIKSAITTIVGDRETNVATHQEFVKALHGSLQAGKARRQIDYFILNYDTLIEDALGLEQIPYCDGFSGTATGWWEPQMYKTAGEGARVFKLHGSIDWSIIEGDPLPRRIRSGIKTASATGRVLIYPASTKYQESQRDPFAQMTAYLRKTLSPSETSEMILGVCGYSFRDPHIDAEVERALRLSSGRLTVVAFVGTDSPEGVLKKWISDPMIADQVRVFANTECYHGSRPVTLGRSVPWWKFGVLAKLLGGER